ncbi:stage V sporulation protein E [Desulfuribacillus stibiiarsenatis]|uniref:Stage V sporulation protein E n=1 Tax=Desulfuribacillus stibiiarsenatis TaxID=1390249 RepID=A0A1E5L3P6_9FIRM|nr:stage V sporulation protein E [Desulfuribacillus stibiiarsenatis]OEH84711.1 stage V sporulation protein E [Desulfuribacillus stibiiarsenatis]
MGNEKPTPDYLIVMVTVALLGIGVIVVYSSSAVLSLANSGDSFYFAKRQLLWAIIGVIAMLGIMKYDYWKWQSLAPKILIGCYFFLLIVLIPGIGSVRNGARSWIDLGFMSLQPAEFAKLGTIIFLSYWLSRNQDKITDFKRGFLPPLGICVMTFGIIMLQPDLGTGSVLFLTGMIIIFTAGAKLKHLFGIASLAVPAFVALVFIAPYRIKRLTSFLDPWGDPLNTGYHIIQSLYAIGPGGLMGLGLGRSRQKFFYLPEPQTDFIFSILAEELGFIGGSLVICLFILLIWRGMRVAITAPDLFGTFLATGITGMVAVQVIINIGVVTGSFPVTGITLPFISYGGSSLVLMLCSIGVLLNISKYSR